MTGLNQDYFAPVRGFIRLPNRLDLEGVGAAIVGVPFDMGVAPVRVGSRMGPSLIREESEILQFYDPAQPELDIVETLGLIDCGDIRLWPGEREKSWERIEDAMAPFFAAGVIPVAFGGDGAVSYPHARAASKRHDGLVLLHFDAHTDSYAPPEQGAHTTGTTFTYAAQHGVFDVERSFHIGARRPVSSPVVYEHTRSLGYRLIPDGPMRERGFEDVLAEVRDVVGDRPVYLCWDMDFYDPACAPAVCNPVWGGISAREGFDIIRGLEGLNVVAVDINTVSPPHDANGMTGMLAGQTALECLYMIAQTRLRETPART